MPGWKDEAQRRVKEKQEGATLKVDEGPNCVRCLPDKKDITPDGKLNPKGMQHSPVREFRTHRDVGPDKVFNLRCGKNIEGKGKCWLCTKVEELETSGIASKVAMADAIQAKEQFVVQATKFDPAKNTWSKPKPWWVSTGSGIPGKQGQSLAVRIYSKIASGRKDYVDPNKGYNINIERVGSGIKTRYPEVEGDDAPSKVPTAVLLAMKDLDGELPVYDEEEQKSAYFGRPRKGQEERMASEPRRRRPVEEEEAPRRRRPVEDEEPVDEDAPVDVEEEEPLDDAEPVGDEEELEEALEEGEPEDEVEGDEAEPEDDAEVEGEPEDEAEPGTEDEAETEEFEPEPEEEEEQAAPPRRTAPPTKRVAPAVPVKKAAPAPVKKAATPPAKKAAPPPAKKVAPRRK